MREVANGTNSALELSFARKVERPHGLPRGRRQKSRLGLPYQSDVGYAVSTLPGRARGRAALANLITFAG